MRGRKCQQRVLFFIQHNRSIIAIPRRVFRGIFILFFFYKLKKTHLYGTAFNGIVKQGKKSVLDNCGA